MEKWARRYIDQVNFVCIGCAGPQLAVSMGTESKLATCVNGFIASDANMPKWGQLGCNGFIVLGGGEQKILSPATSAFMQVRDLAFKHVEALLDAVLAQGAMPHVFPGQYVRVTGLEKAKELNGQVGICIETAVGEGSRCMVKMLQTKRDLRVKPTNLKVVKDEDEEQDLPDNEHENTTSEESSCDEHAHVGEGENTYVGEEEDAQIEALDAIASVKVHMLDEEHEQCASALRILAGSRNALALQGVLQIFEAHFLHEEQLLDEHLYAEHVDPWKSTSGFSADASARKSHFQDHVRMLNTVRQECKRLKQDGSGAKVSANFVNAVFRDFEKHANTYDNNYADRMNEAIGDTSTPAGKCVDGG